VFLHPYPYAYVTMTPNKGGFAGSPTDFALKFHVPCASAGSAWGSAIVALTCGFETQGSGQLREQYLSLLHVGGVKAFGEPAVDRRQELAGIGAPALALPQAAQARRGAELQ
jgi:hypothetical protein